MNAKQIITAGAILTVFCLAKVNAITKQKAVLTKSKEASTAILNQGALVNK